MKFAEFKKAGHWPTLLAAFLYFDISFMAWVALGPLIVYIVRDMNLAVDEKFTLVAIPVLAGALLAGADGLARRSVSAPSGPELSRNSSSSPRRRGFATSASRRKLSVEIFGLALGIGGASFAVALPQASRWYPPQYQGVVMGIAGAGNMGVVLDTMFAPTIAEHWGWQAVFGVLLVPMLLILAYYAYAAKDAPGERKPVSLKAYGTLLRDPDSRWFMFFYFITFGGFVGLANALPLYFTVQYHVSGVAAGLLVSLIVAFGSGFRPVGGLLADRIGGIRSLSMFFGVVVAAYLVIAFMPEGPAAPAPAGWALTEMPRIAWMSVLLFSIGVLALGMGNGAVFQLIPLRFRHEIGLMTGMVGCAGGIGGFFLPRRSASPRRMTGGFGAGFVFFGLLALLGFLGLAMVKVRWRTTWGAASGSAGLTIARSLNSAGLAGDDRFATKSSGFASVSSARPASGPPMRITSGPASAGPV